MVNIYVILNPNAKKFRTNRSSIKSYELIDYPGLKLFSPDNTSDLETIIARAYKDKPDYICVGGGDGTIHLVITLLLNSFKNEKIPPFLILKEGTMDNIARTINLEGTGGEIIRRLVKAVRNGENIKTFRRDTIRVDDKYCFLFGTGFVTNFLKMAYNGIEKGVLRNSIVAAITAKEALLNIKEGEIFRQEHFSITADGESIDLNPINGLLAGTVEHVGMGFSPLKDAARHPGKFQTIITAMEPRKMLLNIHNLRTGQTINDNGYVNSHFNKMTLKKDGAFDYTMDGELYIAENELKIETGPAVDLVKI